MHGQQNIKFKIILTVQLTFINSTYKKNSYILPVPPGDCPPTTGGMRVTTGKALA